MIPALVVATTAAATAHITVLLIVRKIVAVDERGEAHVLLGQAPVFDLQLPRLLLKRRVVRLLATSEVERFLKLGVLALRQSRHVAVRAHHVLEVALHPCVAEEATLLPPLLRVKELAHDVASWQCIRNLRRIHLISL